MSKKVYELIGVKVKEKLSKITYAGPHAGKKSYQLLVEVDERPEVKKVYAYLDKLGLTGQDGQEKMWKDIEESNYADKRYLFYYQFENKSYCLVGWKELERR